MRAADEVLEVNREEIQALLERARQEPLDEGGYQKLQDLLRAFSYVVDMIGEKDTTISQLRTEAAAGCIGAGPCVKPKAPSPALMSLTPAS